jgi:glyoxylase-like metal-dependent hydrolase (beta-lactamase superfamily II)
MIGYQGSEDTMARGNRERESAPGEKRELFRNQAWQPLPGVPGGSLFPFIRKVDIISSNSYLVATGERLVLVDPGGLPGQAEVLLAEIRHLLEEQPRPVFICLTHVHLDHCLQLLQHHGFRELPSRVVVVQERGARALETADRAATIADIVQVEISPLSADLRLIGGCSQGEEELSLAGTPCITCYDPVDLGGGLVIARQTLPLARGDSMEFFSTPGHSPDSICIRMGGALFIGDLIFATAPAVAGLSGWDRETLISSLDRVIAFLSRGGVTACLPGHGLPLDVPATLQTLRTMRIEAERLAGIEAVNPAWVHETARCAEDLMNEVERLFTIISGKLVFVTHMLGELEEAGEADRLGSLIDIALVDDLLADFARFSAEYRHGDALDIHLALKAGQISGKLERVYYGELLGTLLDLSLVRRAGRLLEDYTTTFRGFRPQIDLQGTDISIAAAEVVSAVSRRGYPEWDLIDTDDQEAFARALAVRIAAVNPFEGLAIEFSPGEHLPSVLLDRERFGDVLLYLLERWAAAGAAGVRLATGLEGSLVWVSLDSRGCRGPLGEAALRFAARSAGLSGGRLDAGDTGVRLEYPAMDTDLPGS